MLGELTREHQTHGSLDLAGRQGGLLVHAGELAGLSHDALEHIVDEGVQDGHGLLGHTSLGVHLLEHLQISRGREYEGNDCRGGKDTQG